MKKKTPRAKTPSVTVLVPIYNVETYLRQCLDSVVGQTLENMEIICINDGSTDGSLDIIKEYMDKDDRIVLIDKKNSGYGDSMNQGLKKARGEYIGIVESDDWIDKNAFRTLYLLGKMHDAEIVHANYYSNCKGKDTKVHAVHDYDSGRVITPRFRTNIFFQAPAIWCSIYRRDFLEKHGIKFLPTPGASYQDLGFNFKVWAMADRVFSTPEAFLHYRTDNANSSVNNPGKVFCVCEEYAEIERFLKEKDLWEYLAPLMMSTKSNVYQWNTYRLAPRRLPGFLDRARAEFSAARKDGLIIKEYFDDPDHWRFVNSLIDHSNFRIIQAARLRHFRLKCTSLGRNLYRHLRPTHAKQRELYDTIDELGHQNALLWQRLNCLEAKLKENRHE